MVDRSPNISGYIHWLCFRTVDRVVGVPVFIFMYTYIIRIRIINPSHLCFFNRQWKLTRHLS